jgi:hypothetical protein
MGPSRAKEATASDQGPSRPTTFEPRSETAGARGPGPDAEAAY